MPKWVIRIKKRDLVALHPPLVPSVNKNISLQVSVVRIAFSSDGNGGGGGGDGGGAFTGLSNSTFLMFKGCCEVHPRRWAMHA